MSGFEPSCRRATPALLTALLVAGVVPQSATAQSNLQVVQVSPSRHSLDASADAKIRVDFDRPLSEASVTARNFWAFGRWSGVVEGKLSLSDRDRTVTLAPQRRFSAGETVMVILSRELQAADGTFLRDAGYSFQFWVRSRGAGLAFEEIDRFSTRSSPAVSTRSYGGFGSDLDGDGFLDLTIVNEDTNDLRTFLNRGDRSGTFFDFLRPAPRTENVPSPSEPSDFDRDGNVDVVVANTQDDSVSVFFGRGDGTFEPADNYTVGGEPRGVTVLDADGDGDVDIAATSFFDGNLTILLNDGEGEFPASRTFGTQRGERAIAAGDMNDDGLLDLVVGALTAEEVDIYTALGDGTFDLGSRQSSGGEVWMLVLGDVDGDGAEDVAAVNSESNNASILIGDGAGGLGEPRIVVTDGFPLATDLADLDGDGDLDWMTSSFFGNWQLWENDGDGGFSLARDFAAPQAASCTLPMDLDNDGVLDLVLIDELEDEIVLVKNRAQVFSDDLESGDLSAWRRERGAVQVVGPGLEDSLHALEIETTSRASYVQSSEPSKEASLIVSFDVDLGELDLSDDPLEILRMGNGRGQARLLVEKAGRRARATLLASEKGGFRTVGSTKLGVKSSTRLQVEWASASGRKIADGFAALRKDGKLRGVAFDLSNHGKVIKRVRLGVPNGAPASVSGSLLVDNYLSTR